MIASPKGPTVHIHMDGTVIGYAGYGINVDGYGFDTGGIRISYGYMDWIQIRY